MSKKTSLDSNKKSKNRLFLTKDSSVERHPSVKNLLNQINNPEPLPTNNIISISTNNENSQENNINIGINIIPCEHKIKDEKETFFIESNENNNNIINNSINNIKIVKPSFYTLNEEQKKLDKKITNLMEEGKDYSTIEKQFKDVLKK